MKRKVKVTYSVEYIQEIELEVSELQNKWLEKGIVHSDTMVFEQIYNQNQDDVLYDLPIPTLVEFDSKFGQEFKEIEYVDGSFDIKSFAL